MWTFYMEYMIKYQIVNGKKTLRKSLWIKVTLKYMGYKLRD